MPRQHLFFDLDGTLTLPARGIVNCIRHAMQVMGVPEPEGDLSRYVGPPLQQTFATLLATDAAEPVEQAVAAYRERFADVGYLENEAVEGIDACLQQCGAAGASLYVVTSKPAVYANPILDHFELNDHFVAVHGAELDGTRSDKTELIAHVLETHALDAAFVTMIGDRRHDIEGAKANGVRALGVLWGYGSRDELEAVGADMVFSSVKDLADTLR